MTTHVAFSLLLLACSPQQDSQEVTPDEPVAETPTPQLMDARTGDQVTVESLVADLAKLDVIFLGEQHNNNSGHNFQFDVIKALVETGADVVVSTEQFERDVQGVLDDYLAGRIDEDKFLSHSRPWKNYQDSYRPIVEFAKENKLPVLAANLPRSLATKLSKSEPISAANKVFLPRTTSTPTDAYWDKFNDTMKGHIGADGANKIKAFYASQCAKDDAMAESITDYLAKNQHEHKVVVHLNGHFHSDYGLGTAARVNQRMPLAKTAVFTMESIPDDGELTLPEARSRAHYVFWTSKNAPKDAAAKENPS
jgi:uncharacterized iron-regulated protein